jgi:type IV pilus assembly protein PilW
MEPRAVKQRGATLAELLVATTLLSVVVTAGLTAISFTSASRREAAALQHLHERAQYALATLEPELQMAGYFGADTGALGPVGEAPEPAARCGGELIARVHRPVEVLPSWSLPCPANNGGAVDSSHVLVLRRLSSTIDQEARPGRARWREAAAGATGQLVWDGTAGGVQRELLVRIYYVARQSDGDALLPALRVKSLTSIAGTPAFVDTEVMNGIEQLHVQLLPSETAPRLARIRLRLRGEATELRAGAAPPALEVTRTFALRNAG